VAGTDHSWVFDLVSPDPSRRRAALSRHRDLLDRERSAWQRLNAISAEGGEPAPPQPHLAAAWDQASAEQRDARGATLFGPIDQFLAVPYASNLPADERHAPFAALFLRWERRYPAEWSEAGAWTSSHWSTKELVLRRFAEGGVPAGVRADLHDLVVAAVTGPYRCKDWWYAPLARWLDSPLLRQALAEHATYEDALPRLRAGFLLQMLDQPRLTIRRHTWQRWLAAQPE
jgi:hypothetical protein